MTGRTLAHHHVLEKPGAVGMGEVYLASDVKLDREVALQVLLPKFASDPEWLARFERESRGPSASPAGGSRSRRVEPIGSTHRRGAGGLTVILNWSAGQKR